MHAKRLHAGTKGIDVLHHPGGVAPRRVRARFSPWCVFIVLGDQVKLHPVPSVAHPGALPDVIERLGPWQQPQTQNVLIELDTSREVLQLAWNALVDEADEFEGRNRCILIENLSHALPPPWEATPNCKLRIASPLESAARPSRHWPGSAYAAACSTIRAATLRHSSSALPGSERPRPTWMGGRKLGRLPRRNPATYNVPEIAAIRKRPL